MSIRALLRILLPALSLFTACLLRGEVAVNFSTSDPGVVKTIPDWGLDTNWASEDNMRRGISFMGVENVNLVRVPGMVDKVLDSGLTSEQKEHMLLCKRLAAMATYATRWDLCAPGSDTVNPWFQSGAGVVNTDRWIAALKLNQEFYDHPIWLVEPFNEPDYATWGEGTQQNLLDIIKGLKALPNFSESLFGGGSTMSAEAATPWFDALKGEAQVGTTHTLYGSVANYVDFLKHVADAKAIPFHPEGHNVVECIIGAEYGLQGMIWWGTAELVRGEFVKACKGSRLGYAEDRPNWTAAAVYRAPSGKVQAFLGGSERIGGTTTYTLHCSDRDVYFDGHGPQRDYSVTIMKDQERMVNITWGDDVPVAVGGRYVIVNASSGLCLEIEGASTASGAALAQNAYTGGNHQLWEVTRLSSASIGDQSFFRLANVNSTIYADVPAWVYDDELVIRQYNYPDNAVEHWYFEYAGKGCYRIRSRWSNKCLAPAKTGGPLGAQVVQRTLSNATDQLWRLQKPETTPKAVALQISSQPQPLDAAPGQTMCFTVSAAGTGRLNYQWQLNGKAIDGATSARLVIGSVREVDAGDYSVVVSDLNTSVTSANATLRVRSTPDLGRLNNLSIRSVAGTGSETLTVGFVVGGPAGRKTVLVRGIGPSLGIFGLTGVLSVPHIGLFNEAGLLQAGDAWGGSTALSTAFDAVGAFGLDKDSKDAALLPDLPTGVYTAQLTGANGGTGVALMELYDMTPPASFDGAKSPRLTNASARTRVGINDETLIAGFAIGGSTARTVLIRAVGPTLAAFGVGGTLVAPRLDLIRDGKTLATNIGWGGESDIAAASNSVGAFGLGRLDSKDSVLLISLPPGTYSAKVSGADGGTGVALVEVYDLP